MPLCFGYRLTSKRKSTGDGVTASTTTTTTTTVAATSAATAAMAAAASSSLATAAGADETFAHKKRRRALKQMQDTTAAADKDKAESQDGGGGAVQKTMVLPKKRPLAGSNQQQQTAAATAATAAVAAAAPKKQCKAGDEAVDDETLIRETEAALKSLSGGWPGPRHSFYRTGHDDDNRYESPAFVNLFDEKKIGGGNTGHQVLLAAKVDENKNTCNVKPPPAQLQQQQQQQTVQKELGGEKKSSVAAVAAADKYAPSKYEPDFNELVDDSSDELEIDMAGGGGSGGDCGKDDDRTTCNRRKSSDVDRRNNNNHVRVDEMSCSLVKSEPDGYDAYLMDKTAFSAFRPVSGGGGGDPKDSARLDLPTAVGAAMSQLGPYPPTGATFVVGYTTGLPSAIGGSPTKLGGLSPGAGGGVSNVGGGCNAIGAGDLGGSASAAAASAVKPVCVKIEDDGGAGNAADCKPDVTGKMDSPSPLSKQYTILQPAGADSRAATALQDVAREGVLGASVVSAGGGNLSPRTAVGGAAGCMNNNKGEYYDFRNDGCRVKYPCRLKFPPKKKPHIFVWNF